MEEKLWPKELGKRSTPKVARPPPVFWANRFNIPPADTDARSIPRPRGLRLKALRREISPEWMSRSPYIASQHFQVLVDQEKAP